MTTTDRISAADVDRARDEIDRRRAAWARYGSRPVSPQEIPDAEAHVRDGRGEVRQYSSWAWRKAQLTFGVLWGLQRSRLVGFGWVGGGLLGGTAVMLLAAIPIVLSSRSLIAIYAALAVAFALGFAGVGGTLAWCGDVAATLAALRARLSARRASLALIRQRLHGWEDHLATLRAVDRAETDYNRAVDRHKELVDRLKSRRYRLKHTDWRCFRGTDFENYVAEIFEELGYRVQKTKVTGDQGVDLLVHGKGRSIAVQTKGYANGVGNKAVQEVYAGMKFYGCHECVAVTNSTFTTGAVSIASAVGCRLIDCHAIPDLIDGQVY